MRVTLVFELQDPVKLQPFAAQVLLALAQGDGIIRPGDAIIEPAGATRFTYHGTTEFPWNHPCAGVEVPDIRITEQEEQTV